MIINKGYINIYYLATSNSSIDRFFSFLFQLTEFPYDDLKTVFDAMYSGLLGLSAANIDSVYDIVKKLKIDAFIAMCDSVSSRLPRPLNANSGQSMPSTAFNLLQAKLQVGGLHTFFRVPKYVLKCPEVNVPNFRNLEEETTS